MVKKKQQLQRIFIGISILVFALSGCQKGSEFEQSPLVGEWNINGISIGIYHGMEHDLELIQEMPVEEGGIIFKSNQKASFIGEDNPKWMPKRFDWDIDEDTLIMEVFGYEIKSLFNITKIDSVDYLDIMFGTDSLGIIMELDTVMQLNLHK